MKDLVFLNIKKKPRPLRRLPPLNALRAFEVVGRLGSVTAAADELHVTRGAVSQQLKQLEDDVGMKLLRSIGTGVELTEAGAQAHEPLSAAFRLMQVAVNRMHLIPRRPQLRLSCEPALAANWLIARLPGWRALEGAVPVVLDPSKQIADLAAREADVAIRFGKGDYPGLTTIKLFEDETIFPVCAPCLVHRGRGLKAPKDLRQHTLLRLDWKSRSGLWPDWSAWLLAAGLPDLALELDELIEEEAEGDAEAGPGGDGGAGETAGHDADAAKSKRTRPKRFRSLGFADSSLLLKAALEGQGVALGQSSLVQDLIRQGQLVAPFAQQAAATPADSPGGASAPQSSPGALKTGFGYYLVYPPELEDRNDLALFRDWIVKEAKAR